MATKQGDLALLDDPVAQELLQSINPARLAYVWRDGTPRVVPIWFQWTGEEIVLDSPLEAPKLRMLQDGTKVALTIDTVAWPAKTLLLRGVAKVDIVDGLAAEYVQAARRYLGDEAGAAWVQQVGSLSPQSARIAIRPEWVGILDFQQRFPSAVEAAIARVSTGG